MNELMNPFIPLTCEEIVSIKVLSHRASTRIRILGELRPGPRNQNSDFRILRSLGEDIVTEVLIDFSLILDQLTKFGDNHVVQVLGDLHQVDEDSPVFVQAIIIRNLQGLDPELYHKAIAAQSLACPRNTFNTETQISSPTTGDTPKTEESRPEPSTTANLNESKDFFESSF